MDLPGSSGAGGKSVCTTVFRNSWRAWARMYLEGGEAH